MRTEVEPALAQRLHAEELALVQAQRAAAAGSLTDHQGLDRLLQLVRAEQQRRRAA